MEIILAMIKKEFAQLKQDKRLLAISMVAPVIQVILFSYAANIDVKNIKIGFVDSENTPQTREIRELFKQSGYFDVVSVSETDEKIDNLLDAGGARIILKFGSRFTEKLIKKNEAPIQLLVDGSDGNTATIAVGYTQGILNSYNQKVMTEIIEKRGAKPNIASINAETRVWYNPELKTMNFMVPGILGMVLLIASTITSAISIVKEKENGTLEQLIVTPIKPYQIILGKLIPFSITSSIAVLLIMIVNIFLMQVPMKGSVLLLIVVMYVYLTTTLGLGLFISTISQNQQQASLTTVFIIIPPFVFFSGFVFPVENMPMIIQYFSTIIPMKYFLVMMRSIFLKGVGLEILWKDILAISAFSTIIISLAIMRFHKKLE